MSLFSSYPVMAYMQIKIASCFFFISALLKYCPEVVDSFGIVWERAIENVVVVKLCGGELVGKYIICIPQFCKQLPLC